MVISTKFLLQFGRGDLLSHSRVDRAPGATRVGKRTDSDGIEASVTYERGRDLHGLRRGNAVGIASFGSGRSHLARKHHV